MDTTETYINLDTAKLAKKAGFDYSTDRCYAEYIKTKKSDNPSFNMVKGEVEINSGYFINGSKGSDYSCKYYVMYAMPTQASLQKWLREQYNCIVEAIYQKHNSVFGGRIFYISTVDYYGKEMNLPMSGKCDYMSDTYFKYEEALEIGLQEALKLIKN